MVDRWSVERAVKQSHLDPPGRHLLLTLATWADHATAVVPAEYTPSLTVLREATGLARSTVKTWLNFLEVVGWVVRARPDPHAARTNKARTHYALRIPPRAARALRGPGDLAGQLEAASACRGDATADSTDTTDAPGDLSTSDIPDVARPLSGPTRPGIPDVARPAGGPTASDMPDLARPAGGPAPHGARPFSGPIMSGMPDLARPLSGPKPNEEKTNRACARPREEPLVPPAAGSTAPLSTEDVDRDARVVGHRYVEGPNGYCAVPGCGRSAPMHPATTGGRRRATPLRWRPS